MDTLVTIGVLASILYSTINLLLIILGNKEQVEYLYFESAAMILYFIKLGRFIDGHSKEKTKKAIKELVTITPETALLKTAEGEKEVTIDEVKKGDLLICKPGMKIAVDGVIIEGVTHLDEAFLTGESTPSKKQKNDKVIAGSINIDGVIVYKAEKIGPDSTISEVVRLVVEAVNTKAPIQRLADIVAGYFVPTIMIITMITFLVYLILGYSFHESIISFVTILVVACPCALGLATPLAVVASVGRGAKEGILIKTSETLEMVSKIDTVVFDKTGTLTYGNLKIAEFKNYSSYTEEEILQMVASLENNSTHPMASAFKDYYSKNIKVTNFQNMAGIGLTGMIGKKQIFVGNAKLFEKLKLKNSYQKEEEKLLKQGNSIVYVIEDEKVLALIGVKDIERGDAKDMISSLKKMKKEVIMLSGDNLLPATLIAKSLGIEKVVANVMSKEKEEFLRSLIADDHFVMMVGDGINDAPSLAAANIGVSMNSGTDIAYDSADVILMNDDLGKIINLFDISRKTIKIIKENLFWAFFYNILMIPIAMGLLKPVGISITPMLASLFMTLSSLCVVFNSLRLQKGGKNDEKD